MPVALAHVRCPWRFAYETGLLAQTSPSKQDAVLITELLSLPNDGRYTTLGLTPEQCRQKKLQALISQVQALTRSKPMLMIVEDAHWTDPSSLVVSGRVVDRIAMTSGGLRLRGVGADRIT